LDLGLTGKHCFVTGASSGIGRAAAVALAAEGAYVTILGRDETALAETCKAVSTAGGDEAKVILADLATDKGIDRSVQSLAAIGRPVQVLVNNAGGSRAYSLDANPTADQWNEALTLNFTSARRLAEFVLPSMRQARWGRIITVTGALALKHMNAATPAKAAITSWSRALSIQVARDGVTVNCVLPGRIHSAQIDRIWPTEQAKQAEVEANVPIGRFGDPEELAAMIAFLASPRASYVTGALIPVDGGLLRLDLK
jgi:3-oxoacyl-[acyl-carrier protein] reductase